MTAGNTIINAGGLQDYHGELTNERAAELRAALGLGDTLGPLTAEFGGLQIDRLCSFGANWENKSVQVEDTYDLYIVNICWKVGSFPISTHIMPHVASRFLSAGGCYSMQGTSNKYYWGGCCTLTMTNADDAKTIAINSIGGKMDSNTTSNVTAGISAIWGIKLAPTME